MTKTKEGLYLVLTKNYNFRIHTIKHNNTFHIIVNIVPTHHHQLIIIS